MTTAPIPGIDHEIALALMRELRRTDPDRSTRVDLAAGLRCLARTGPDKSLAGTLYMTARALRSC